MIVNSTQRITWTYLVFQEEAPSRGEYVDPRGNHWYAHQVDPEGLVLREPGPPAWHVSLQSSHPAYRLEPGEELRRFFRPDEIGARREKLRLLLCRMLGFDYVGVSEDGFTLVANFVERAPEPVGVPTEVDGMPVIVSWR